MYLARLWASPFMPKNSIFMAVSPARVFGIGSKAARGESGKSGFTPCRMSQFRFPDGDKSFAFRGTSSARRALRVDDGKKSLSRLVWERRKFRARPSDTIARARLVSSGHSRGYGLIMKRHL